MYIESAPNRNSAPAVLLRESYRQDGKVKKRTLANLSALPGHLVEGLKVLLHGGVAVASAEEVFVIERSLPHGHVAATLDWISSLRAPQLAQLAQDQGPLQASLFDERGLIELDSAAFPGERLVVCRNPLLAQARARKREDLLAATEAQLAKIGAATARA